MNKNILIIYTTFNKARPVGDPSIWYRCFAFAEKIKERNKSVTCHLLSSDCICTTNWDSLRKYDAVIFFRPIQSPELIELVKKLKSYGVTLFSSYDDLTFTPDSYAIASTLKSHARINLIHNRYKDWANALLIFDNVLVSTEALKKEVKSIHPNSNVIKVSNSLPNSIINHINYLRKGKKNQIREFVGYFGGGLSHKNDIISIEDELSEYLEYSKKSLLLPKVIYQRVGKRLQKKSQSFDRVSYYEMFKLYMRSSINISPLILDRNSKCKSEIKFIESALSGSPVVSTNIEAYDAYSMFSSIVEAKENTWVHSLKVAEGYNLSEREIIKVTERMNEIFDSEVQELKRNIEK